MKLQLDTTARIIKVEGIVNLDELFIALRKLLPEGLWKKFSIESNTTIVWTTPVTVHPFYPYYPWWSPQPAIIYGSAGITSPPYGDTLTSGDVTYSLNQGTYNIEI
jgi:hypothetical protein